MGRGKKSIRAKDDLKKIMRRALLKSRLRADFSALRRLHEDKKETRQD